MPGRTTTEEQLKGWNDIAEYMGQTTATVQRWAKSGMPVSREGRSVVASKEELRSWLGDESGHQATHIITNETDLGEILEHGLKDARANRKAHPSKPPGESRRRVQRPAPVARPQIPPYTPVLPFSQVESRIAGLEKRLKQLQELMKVLEVAEKRRVSSETKRISSAIAHYESALEIERSLEDDSKDK